MTCITIHYITSAITFLPSLSLCLTICPRVGYSRKATIKIEKKNQDKVLLLIYKRDKRERELPLQAERTHQ